MLILLGSKSEQKERILNDFLSGKIKENYKIISYKLDSGVDEQPLNLADIKKGAINRAKNVVKIHKSDYDLSFGMEGGLLFDNGLYNLMCAVVIIDKSEKISFGESELLSLPRKVSDSIIQGNQFGEIIREYYQNTDIHDYERNDIIELINRSKSFTQALERAWDLFEK